MDRDNMFVAQRSQCLGFVNKSFTCPVIVCQSGGKHLDGDEPVHFGVLGPKDYAPAASADDLHHFVEIESTDRVRLAWGIEKRLRPVNGLHLLQGGDFEEILNRFVGAQQVLDTLSQRGPAVTRFIKVGGALSALFLQGVQEDRALTHGGFRGRWRTIFYS
jgi:hypothetical protein